MLTRCLQVTGRVQMVLSLIHSGGTVFKVDFLDQAILRWTITEDGADYTRHRWYHPTIYIGGEKSALMEVFGQIQPWSEVVDTALLEKRTRWRGGMEPVLNVNVAGIEDVDTVAYRIRKMTDPHQVELYNVDFAREFRYCLEEQRIPVPNREPTTLTIKATDKRISDQDISKLEVDGDTYTDPAEKMLETIQDHVNRIDPDILVMSHADIVPLLYHTADAVDMEFQLGRLPGWQQLAGPSTYEQYGITGHSAARYNVPGRAIIDLSNCFWWRETNLDGMFDLVERSWKPIQELAWASIGNVLTSIQIKYALQHDVLVPWKSWRHEQFKSMRTLHDADRGGFIVSPNTGVHEEVYEVDFSSLYPNIMVTRNISPEAVCCDCHDSDDVPGLDYSICDETGYLVEVLRPLIEDREEIKQQIRDTVDLEKREELEGRSEAIKWILVSCFGYQGFSNAKFGRIECHEAINAYAREILLDAKETFEEHGWRVVHGIVDSIWVQPRDDVEPTPIPELCEQITDDIGITLDFEQRYDWIAFCPRRETPGGALNRYFGKVHDSDEYKLRGIEARQRSTPEYIKDCQQKLLDVFDETRDPQQVVRCLEVQVNELKQESVDPEELVIRKRVSKDKEDYRHRNRNVAALERADMHMFDVRPGQDIRYVVVDDSKQSQDRVRLDFEDMDEYDAAFYADELIRAAESILLPLGWDRQDIKRQLSTVTDADLAAYLKRTKQ